MATQQNPLPKKGPPPPPPPLEPPIKAAPAPLKIKVRPAWVKNYSQVKRVTPRIIVIHCTDGCEGTSKDDDVAAMFAGKLDKPRSAHYVVDADSVTRCVPDLQTAWHSGHTGNGLGIGIELCGRASQSRAEWLDKDSLPTLQLAARLCIDLCKRHSIPAVLVNAGGLVKGLGGITTHALVSVAWHESTHFDPGPGFPFASFVDAVARGMA